MTAWSSEEQYLRAEWDQFLARPELGARTLAAVEGRTVATVLDVGCGAGQELLPFVTTSGALGVGVDLNATSVAFARQLLADVPTIGCVEVACGRAEAVPMRDGWFDVVICRGVLVYTDVAAAVSELARVLRPGGVAIVQVGNLRQELRSLRRNVRRHPEMARTAWDRIRSGTAHRLRGRQPTSGAGPSQVYFSRRSLARELRRAGLAIIGEVAHGNPRVITVVATHRR